MSENLRPLKDRESKQLFTIEKFVEYVRDGMFIDYDGWGYYANPPMVNADWDDKVYPSEVLENGPKPGYTHVVWYNR